MVLWFSKKKKEQIVIQPQTQEILEMQKQQKIQVANLSNVTNRTTEYIMRLYNEHQQTRDIVNKIQKMVIDHVQTESLRRIEDLVVMRMFSRNILEFRIEKLIYFKPEHSIVYIKTVDNQFFRLDISIDDFLRVKESQFETENRFYCGMYDDIMSLANSVPKDLNGKIIEEAEKVKQICK